MPSLLSGLWQQLGEGVNQEWYLGSCLWWVLSTGRGGEEPEGHPGNQPICRG
jgi:hypothetical protein